MRKIIFLSSGITSWVAGLRTVQKYGAENCLGLFSDTGIEDPDNYRFLEESTKKLEIPLVIVSAGESMWDCWERNRAVPNNRMPFCSFDMKHKPARDWLKANTSPDTDSLVVGIAWDEIHRIPKIKEGWSPYQVDFPMTDKPYLDKPSTLELARSFGIDPPRLYKYGLPHANCGGGCARAGIAQWKHVLQVLPEVYALWEEKELYMQEKLGKKHTILKRSIRGVTTPYSLKELRESEEEQLNIFESEDWGGCGCFSDNF